MLSTTDRLELEHGIPATHPLTVDGATDTLDVVATAAAAGKVRITVSKGSNRVLHAGLGTWPK